MWQERQPGRPSLEEIAAQSREIMLEDGKHVPTLIVDGSNGTYIMRLPLVPETPELTRWLFNSIGVALAQKAQVGSFRRVIIIHEGWLRKGGQGEVPTTIPPFDPERIEVLMVASRKVGSKQTEFILFELERDSDNQLVDLKKLDYPGETRGRHHILDIFVEGFQTGRGKLN